MLAVADVVVRAARGGEPNCLPMSPQPVLVNCLHNLVGGRDSIAARAPTEYDSTGELIVALYRPKILPASRLLL